MFRNILRGFGDIVDPEKKLTAEIAETITENKDAIPIHPFTKENMVHFAL